MSDEQFVLDLLFVARFADDHEDAATDILELISEDPEEFELEDVIFATDLASMYHYPTSEEVDAIMEIHKVLAERSFNG